MGIIMGALAGLGEGLADVGRRNQIAELQKEQEQRAAARDIDMTKLRDELEANRQRSLADYQEQKREAPAKRFGIIAQAKANEDVPLEAAPVTEVNDSNFKGSVSEISKLKDQMTNIIANPDKYTPEQVEDAAGAIAAMNASLEKQGVANAEMVAGKTRKRSANEAANAAYDEAMISDPTAAIAMHPILREARAEKKTDAEIQDRKARSDRLEKKQDLQLEYQMAKEERLMTYQENQQKYQQSLMNSNTEKEKQAAVNGMRKSTEIALDKVDSELRSLRKDLSDPGIDPSKKAELQSMKKELEAEAKRYRTAMANNGFELPEVEAAPAPFPAGTVKNGYEFLGGDVKNPSSWKPVSASSQAATPAAQAGTPPPPDNGKKRWIGNDFVVSPAYKAWEQQYGAAYQAKKAEEAKIEQQKNQDIIQRLGNQKL